MTTFSTGGSAVTFTTSGSAVSFAVTPASNAFTTSAVLTPGAHASTHGAGGADPITTLGTVTTTLGTVTTLVAGAATFMGAALFADGAAGTPSITNDGDPNTGIYFPAADQVGISTAGTAAVIVNGSGNVGIGPQAPTVRLHLSTNAAASQQHVDSGAATSALIFRRANTSLASPSIVANADNLGDIVFQGHDGSVGFRPAARIRGAVDGTPGASDMPGRLMFYTTADGGVTETERMRIDNAGNVTFPASPSVGITSAGAFQPQSNLTNSANDDTAAFVQFYKNRGGTAVSSGDSLGNFYFIGFDGSAYRNAAAIVAAVDGAPGASDMPGRLSFQTTADGSATLTERMRIDNAGLITGTGTSLGAWGSWTPVIGNTWVIGNGTVAGRYCQIGKIIHFTAKITMGSSTTFGSDPMTITLPVNANTAGHLLCDIRYSDVSVGAEKFGWGRYNSTSTIAPQYYTGDYVTTTSPFTWQTDDTLIVSGTYEIA